MLHALHQLVGHMHATELRSKWATQPLSATYPLEALETLYGHDILSNV